MEWRGRCRTTDDADYYRTLQARVSSASQKFRMERVAEKYAETYMKIV